MIINKEPTKPPPGHSGTGWVHYNMENSPVTGKKVWDVKKLLEVGIRVQETERSTHRPTECLDKGMSYMKGEECGN